MILVITNIYFVLSTLFKFCLGIVLIVGIHEFGHLFFAKYFGVRVDEYMIGMPPRILTKKWNGTQYGIGALPFQPLRKWHGRASQRSTGNPYRFKRNDARHHWLASS